MNHRVEFDWDADTATAAALAFQTADPSASAAWRAARRRTLLTLAGVLFISLLPWIALDTPLPVLAGAALGGGAVGVIRWLSFAGSYRRAVERQLRHLFRDTAGEASLGRRTIEFGARYVRLTTSYSREEFCWGAVLRVRETPDFLLVTLPGPRPLAVPRSALTAAAFDDLADHLRSHTGETV